MHGKCQAWDPQGKSVACPCLPAKAMDSFSQQVPLVLLESLWITPAGSASLAAGFGPWSVWGEEGGSQAGCDHNCCYSWHLFCTKALGTEENGPCGHLDPFLLLCLMPNTGECTHRQKRVHLSVNKGCLFKMRMNSEFWQPSVWGCLLWG